MRERGEREKFGRKKIQQKSGWGTKYFYILYMKITPISAKKYKLLENLQNDFCANASTYS